MSYSKSTVFVLGLGFGCVFGLGGLARADLMQTSPQNPTVSTTTPVISEVVPGAAPTVVVPPPEVAPVTTTNNNATAMKQEREGDYYVIRGNVELDRPRNVLRIKDSAGNWIEMVYNENNVHIYRRGQPISYLDVNTGDDVTVRYKGI
jgi:hypothetical protein